MRRCRRLPTSAVDCIARLPRGTELQVPIHGSHRLSVLRGRFFMVEKVCKRAQCYSCVIIDDCAFVLHWWFHVFADDRRSRLCASVDSFTSLRTIALLHFIDGLTTSQMIARQHAVGTITSLWMDAPMHYICSIASMQTTKPMRVDRSLTSFRTNTLKRWANSIASSRKGICDYQCTRQSVRWCVKVSSHFEHFRVFVMVVA